MAAKVRARMDELDILRGFAVAIMILVVSPGAWGFAYAELQHADWNGWTLADLVFPDFLFGVGMALGLTFGRSLDPRGAPRAFATKVARRVIALILLGLALNYLAVVAGWLGMPPVGPDDVTTWRIPGVLQRIALCYLVAVLAVIVATMREPDGAPRSARPWVIGAIIAVILLAYWALLTFVPVPGYGAGDWSMAGNLPAWIDRAIFTPRHMWPLGSTGWRKPVLYDPEGLLSTLPAVANVLFGVLTVGIWRDRPRSRGPILALAGVALIVGALLLDPVVPINKKLWSVSFVLLTSGFSVLALLLVALLLRIPRAATILAPLRVLGGNAILAFSLSIVLGLVAAVPFIGAGPRVTLQQAVDAQVIRVIPDPWLASLACALLVLGFIAAIVWPLHRRGIHLRL